MKALKLDSGEKGFKWVVEFIVAESWIADGFNLDDERAKAMLAETLHYAYNTELDARVLKSPDPKAIRKAQGY